MMRCGLSNFKKRNVGLIIITVLFVFSCIEKKQKAKNIDFSFENQSKSTLSETISNYSIVKLETTEQSKINIPKKVIINDEKLYILNHRENKQDILIFSLDGEYLNKISNKEDGENEFSNISDFDIHPVNGHIILLDQDQRKLVSFDENTDFIENHSINCPAEEMVLGIKNGKIFTVLHTKQQKAVSDDCFAISIYSENNYLSKSLFPFKTMKNTVQSKSKTLMKWEGKVMFLQDGTDKLYKIDEKSCALMYKLLFPKPVLPAEKRYDAFYSGQVDLRNYIYDVDYFESDNILYTSFSSVDGHFIGIYNKDSECSSLYNMLLDPKCKCGVKIDIVGTYQNKFIVQIPRTQISNVLTILDSVRSKCNNPEMFKIIDDMKPGENPVLLLLALK